MQTPSVAQALLIFPKLAEALTISGQDTEIPLASESQIKALIAALFRDTPHQPATYPTHLQVLMPAAPVQLQASAAALCGLRLLELLHHFPTSSQRCAQEQYLTAVAQREPRLPPAPFVAPQVTHAVPRDQPGSAPGPAPAVMSSAGVQQGPSKGHW